MAATLAVFYKYLKSRALARALEEMVEGKTAELLALNASLENRVRKAVEESRQQQELMFRQARYAQMGEMLSMIAHQWRQPLNAISATTINLRLILELEERPNDAHLNHCAEFVEQQCTRMSKTISDFMEFFSPSVSQERFPLAKAVENAAAIIRPQLANRGIELRLETTEEMQIRGNRNEMEQVILNLLANARDALEESKGQEKRITVTGGRKEGRVLLAVTDTGGGIREEVLPRIFDPYFTTKPQGKGTGIGLYMSRSIVERHFGGSIQAANGDGGAVFRIFLPAEEETA